MNKKTIDRRDEIREAAEADLMTFIRLVHPKTVLGSVHEDLCSWWEREDAKSHQLVLLPRDHQKSRMIAYRVVWYLTKYPDMRILYISSTANLAEKQLKFMKDILTSDIYRRYWPLHVNPEEGKREKWTSSEISLDHPKRKEENVRDPSIFTGGLTTGLTGLHCDVAVLDDVVVYENAYTDEGRRKVESQYSLLSSIESADSKEWLVGTRYHPKDLYSAVMEMEEDIYDKEGNLVSSDNVYEKFERQVEDMGDGTGEFLWPRQRRSDGKWFGFNQEILAKKRAKYIDRTQFRAQYYNDPNDPLGGGINHDKFQYYDRNALARSGGVWFLRSERLNIVAALDFAYTMGKKSDYTALVVIGIDRNNNIYVLDVDRFKTDRISDYYKSILSMQNKWDFRKIRAEVTSAQSVIVKDLKSNYIRPNGIALSIDEAKPTRHQGSKEERMNAILQPRYDNLQVWHYRGGNCQILEDELTVSHPAHDDVKDALASAIEIAVAPTGGSSMGYTRKKVVSHPRFGGVAYA
jgi:phage terminase large subunit-like protein